MSKIKVEFEAMRREIQRFKDSLVESVSLLPVLDTFPTGTNLIDDQSLSARLLSLNGS